MVVGFELIEVVRAGGCGCGCAAAAGSASAARAARCVAGSGCTRKRRRRRWLRRCAGGCAACARQRPPSCAEAVPGGADENAAAASSRWGGRSPAGSRGGGPPAGSLGALGGGVTGSCSCGRRRYLRCNVCAAWDAGLRPVAADGHGCQLSSASFRAEPEGPLGRRACGIFRTQCRGSHSRGAGLQPARPGNAQSARPAYDTLIAVCGASATAAVHTGQGGRG